MTWCTICCTQHESRADCPGPLMATGPERHGRRVTVAGQGRTAVHGVLIAEAGEHWRARILTYPKMLWSVPGERGTLKFVGRSPQEVEAKATKFILQVCKFRGCEIVEDAEVPESSAVDAEGALLQAPRVAGEQRHLKSLPIHFGREKPTERGRTADLSRGGVFVITNRPLPPGTRVRLRLKLEGFSVPLEGEVAWTHTRFEQGRPPGMGIQLRNPPAMYSRYVPSLAERQAEALS